MLVGKKRYNDVFVPEHVHPEELGREIGMQEWAISSERLLTIGATTCTVMAAHNAVSKKGLIGHFTSISEMDSSRRHNHEQFDEAVVAIDGLGTLAFTKIWLGGSAPFIERGVDTVEPDRKYAEHRVANYLINRGLEPDQLAVDWSQPNRAVDLELDCEEGILLVHDYPDVAGILLSR